MAAYAAGMTLAEHLGPFVLPSEAHTVERNGAVDLYLPDAELPRPAIVFVHGGPVPAAQKPTPRGWPLYQGYGSAAAGRGVVGAVVDHRLHSPAAYKTAADDVAEAVELVRADPRVDGDRVALWFFSGGALLLADWLRTPPAWVRCVAASYPLLTPFPGWDVDPRFRPVEAVAEAGTPPIVLTRVGLEHPVVAAGVEEFVTAANASAARLEIIDVPNGRHGFDYLDHTDESRAAVERALESVLTALT